MDTKTEVKVKLWLIMAVMVMFPVVMGAVAYFTLARTGAIWENIINKGVAFDELADDVHLRFIQLRRFEKDILLNSGNPQEQANYLQKHQHIAAQLPPMMARMDAMVQQSPNVTPEVKRQAAQLKDTFQTYQDNFSQTIPLVQAGQLTPQQANQRLQAAKAATEILEADIHNLEMVAERIMEATSRAAIHIAHEAKLFMIIVVGGALATAILLGGYLSRAIYRAIFVEGLRQKLGPDSHLSQSIVDKLEKEKKARRGREAS
jgi:methyl-accepting chemotaxis protein